MNDKTAAIIAITILGIAAMFLNVGDGMLVAAITGIAGLAGYSIAKNGR